MAFSKLLSLVIAFIILVVGIVSIVTKSGNRDWDKEFKEYQSCEQYQDEVIANVPVRCYGYFNIR